jgi:membrane protein YdbS with pleckstrin-like domain
MSKKVPASASGGPDAWDRQAIKLMQRFLNTGDLAALHQVIDLLRRAVGATPAGHPNRARLLSNLGGALQERFERGGQIADLEEAIEFGRAAVQATPPDHRNLAGYLSNLGRGLGERFEQVGELADLGEAVEVWRAAVRATPVRHSDRAEYLGNLGVVLQIRFERVGQLADLDDAIEFGRAAVQAAYRRHPDRAAMLGSLGNALWARFERVGQRVDLNEAVKVRRAAVRATPAGHPDRPRHLSNLNLALQAQSGRSGSLPTGQRTAFLEDDPADHEQVVVNVRPHGYGLTVRALRVPVLLLLAAAGVSFVWGWPGEEAVQYTALAVAVGLLIKYSMLPWLRCVTTRYVITTERLIVSKGIVRRLVIDIPLGRIGEVESHSSLIERLFGCGTLVVSGSDGRGRHELPSMPNVSDVGIMLYRLTHGAGR